jgi:hypothetical protein
MTATLPTFEFPNHMVRETYPDPGTTLQLGNSYRFATPPTSPDQRVFTLSFQSTWRGIKADGTMDADTFYDNNAARLLQFYEAHKLHKTFQYKHNWLGMLNVRFNKPLELPNPIKGGDGWTEDFSVEFIEMP